MRCWSYFKTMQVFGYLSLLPTLVYDTYPKSQGFLVMKSWELSHICGCRLDPVGFQGTWEGAEVPGLLAFRDQGRISLCRPESRVPNKRPVLSSLKDRFILFIRPICCVHVVKLLLFLTYAAMCPYMPFIRCGGSRRRKTCVADSHLQLSPSLKPKLAYQQQLCCAAQQLSSASPPSLLPLLPVLQLYSNPGTEMWSQCGFLGNKDNLFWGRVLSS